MKNNAITETVKEFILKEFLPDEEPDALESDTPLISSAILDSVSTIKLVNFLEERYGVEFQPHEMSVDHLDTIADICSIVESKRP